MASHRDLKVAIIGGGMCGVACAVGLVRAGLSVEIFEAAVCSGKYYLQIKHLLVCNRDSKRSVQV